VLGAAGSDRKTAEDLSKSLASTRSSGKRRAKVRTIAAGSRSRTTRIERERVVMPSEIQSLPELTGYLGSPATCRSRAWNSFRGTTPVRHPAIVE